MAKMIWERHRHRYGFNNAFRKRGEQRGWCSPVVEETGIMEIVEIKDHPFMVGSQFHPVFSAIRTSRIRCLPDC